MNKKPSSAFSMVELSIVIAIISTLILGLTKAKAMFATARLSKAQTLTDNSPLKDMDGVAMWLETSLDVSFVFDERQEGGAISTWYDMNQNASSRNNATQPTLASRPKFYENVFYDAIPAVRFDGTNDFMSFNGGAIAGASYTIFVVEQRRSNKSNNYFISGSESADNTNLILGYSTGTNLVYSQYGNALDNAVEAYGSSPVRTMHTFMLNIGTGKKYWLNGGSTPDQSDSVLTPLSSFVGASIGKYLIATSYFEGDVGEIIIFNRALRTEERQVVETYLSKKFGITIS